MTGDLNGIFTGIGIWFFENRKQYIVDNILFTFNSAIVQGVGIRLMYVEASILRPENLSRNLESIFSGNP